MANQVFSGIIRLRKDTEANWALVKNTFIPADGEVCLIESVDFGIKVKVGDGITNFGLLPYVGEHQILETGYYNSQYDCFFKELTYTNIIPATITKLYIDLATSNIYRRLEDKYEKILGVAVVDSENPGLTKLYSNHGSSVDGTMTQKAITNAIDNITFKVSTTDSECLVLNKPW